MIQHDEDLIPYCYEEMKKSGDSTLTTESLAKKLLQVFCETIPKQYIIVDGLDECTPETRQSLIRILLNIVETCDENIHIGKPRLLIVSQKLGAIEKSLARASWMEFGREDNRGDIEQFVNKTVDELKQDLDLGGDIAARIEDFTLQYANG